MVKRSASYIPTGRKTNRENKYQVSNINKMINMFCAGVQQQEELPL